MIDPATLSRMGLWVIATVLGSVGIFCLWASFLAPSVAAYAIVTLGSATAINLALENLHR